MKELTNRQITNRLTKINAGGKVLFNGSEWVAYDAYGDKITTIDIYRAMALINACKATLG
jgi:hypothetical protein